MPSTITRWAPKRDPPWPSHIEIVLSNPYHIAVPSRGERVCPRGRRSLGSLFTQPHHANEIIISSSCEIFPQNSTDCGALERQLRASYLYSQVRATLIVHRKDFFMISDTEALLVSAATAAARLGVHPRTVLRHLPVTRIGRRVLVRVADVEAKLGQGGCRG